MHPPKGHRLRQEIEMHRAPIPSFELRLPLLIAALACVLPSAAALAQQSGTTSGPAQPAATRGLPTPEELEPAVNTTPSAPAAPAAAGSNTAPTAAAADAEASGVTPPSRSAAHAPGPKATSRETAAAPASRKGADRLQLDATEITGNRELPKVLYIVPWKRSDLGDLVGKPVNSLLDEVLEPIDRDVFQRENRYYNGLKPPAAAPKGGVPQSDASKP
jgi:hypothetical protein